MCSLLDVEERMQGEVKADAPSVEEKNGQFDHRINWDLYGRSYCVAAFIEKPGLYTYHTQLWAMHTCTAKGFPALERTSQNETNPVCPWGNTLNQSLIAQFECSLALLSDNWFLDKGVKRISGYAIR